MTREEVKNKINNNKGKIITLRYSLGRNKYEKYQAEIKEAYNNVFVVKLDVMGREEIKSFSYTDIITKTLKIDY